MPLPLSAAFLPLPFARAAALTADPDAHVERALCDLEVAARLVGDAVAAADTAAVALASLAVERAGTATHRDSLDVQYAHLVAGTFDLVARGGHRHDAYKSQTLFYNTDTSDRLRPITICQPDNNYLLRRRIVFLA